MKLAVCISSGLHICILIIVYVITNWAWDHESFKIEGQESISIQAQLVYANTEPKPMDNEKSQENVSKSSNEAIQPSSQLEDKQNTKADLALNTDTTPQLDNDAKSIKNHIDESESNAISTNQQNDQKQPNKVSVQQQEEKTKRITGEQLNQLVSYLYHEINKHKKYPRQAYKMGIEGSVAVNFILYPENNIEGLKVVASSGSNLLDEAALKSIKDAQPFKDASNYLQEKQEFNLVLKFAL